MKDLKFNAWDIEKKAMLYDVCVGNQFSDYDVMILHEPVFGVVISPNSKKFILLQYTGLKDSKRTKEFPKGQEIYEGWVMKVTDSRGNFTLEVVHDGKRFNIFNCSWGYDGEEFEEIFEEYEVIGDIYQNPELLKESKDEKI